MSSSRPQLVRFAVAAIVLLSLLVGLVQVVRSGGPRIEERAGAACVVSDGGASYGWPVVPFFRQHPVRGLFGDPRIGKSAKGRTERTVHFGVDVVAANGTDVYATLTGTVSIHPLHGDTVMVSDGTGRVFEYWHVVPTRSTGRATAYQTVIGHVERPWAHVHFAERYCSRYLNPLRREAMGPFVDSQSPDLKRITFERGGHDIGRLLYGTADVIVEASDAPPTAVPPPWDEVRLTPALVRWRLVHSGLKPQGSWSIAYDTREALPVEAFDSLFALGTRQNRTNRTGRYRIYVLRRWNTGELADGHHTLQIAVSDIRGHTATAVIPFRTANY